MSERLRKRDAAFPGLLSVVAYADGRDRSPSDAPPERREIEVSAAASGARTITPSAAHPMDVQRLGLTA